MDRNIEPPRKPRKVAGSAKKEWTMPEWMEPYRGTFTNTGGNTVEELMTSDATLDNNAILAMLCVACIAQVGMLTQLKESGFLKD